jgi:hypothetical protein
VYAFAISIFGGVTPAAVTWVIAVTGNRMAPAFYMVAAAAVGLVAILLLRETAPLAKKRGPAAAA